MASLAEREDLRGKIQCIYIDPPYGIRFNSNFQWSTTDRDMSRQDRLEHITREPEQVKAFRDTWRDGIHSYLTYLRDRLTVTRDLLANSGSIFVQIGDENVHRVRAVMDEVFGDENFLAIVPFRTSTGRTDETLDSVTNYLLWYAKKAESVKFHQLFAGNENFTSSGEDDFGRYELGDMTSQHPSETRSVEINFRGETFRPSTTRQWSFEPSLISRLDAAGRVVRYSDRQIRWEKYEFERARGKIINMWLDTQFGAFNSDKIYAVQTNVKVIERCILMTTDPGDLVLDPTCGAGTTAYAAEQWGRRWITIDTSRVALALARARIMGARYTYYLLSDSPDGQRKEAEIRRREITETSTYGNVRQGFVYQRVPHVTLGNIANNAEIDVIYEEFQQEMEPMRANLNRILETDWKEWEIPREPGDPWPEGAVVAWHQLREGSNDDEKADLLLILNRELGRDYTLNSLPEQPHHPWDPEATELHQRWWELRIARQKEISASIASIANSEYLYDRPYSNNRKVRVAGPFTVESLSPHRVLMADDGGEETAQTGSGYRYDGDVPERDFAALMLDNLRTSGVQQSQKSGKIDFVVITGRPGEYICAEGLFMEGDAEDAVETPSRNLHRTGVRHRNAR